MNVEDLLTNVSLEFQADQKDLQSQIKKLKESLEKNNKKKSFKALSSKERYEGTLRSLQMELLNKIQEMEEFQARFKEIIKLPDAYTLVEREINILNKHLPVYRFRRTILESIQEKDVTILVADTGSGKSTMLTQFLYSQNEETVVYCCQPRKIAATSLANYTNTCLGLDPQNTIVATDFNEWETTCVPGVSKIVYTTNFGLLSKWRSDKQLEGIDVVIIDETHERTLSIDLLLGIMKQIHCQSRKRPIKTVIIRDECEATLLPYRDGYSAKVKVTAPTVKMCKQIRYSLNYMKLQLFYKKSVTIPTKFAQLLEINGDSTIRLYKKDDDLSTASILTLDSGQTYSRHFDKTILDKLRGSLLVLDGLSPFFILALHAEEIEDIERTRRIVITDASTRDYIALKIFATNKEIITHAKADLERYFEGISKTHIAIPFDQRRGHRGVLPTLLKAYGSNFHRLSRREGILRVNVNHESSIFEISGDEGAMEEIGKEIKDLLARECEALSDDACVECGENYKQTTHRFQLCGHKVCYGKCIQSIALSSNVLPLRCPSKGQANRKIGVISGGFRKSSHFRTLIGDNRSISQNVNDWYREFSWPCLIGLLSFAAFISLVITFFGGGSASK